MVDEDVVDVFAIFDALAGLLDVVLLIVELQPNEIIAENAIAIITVEVLIFIKWYS